jgi:hypothetical protein
MLLRPSHATIALPVLIAALACGSSTDSPGGAPASSSGDGGPTASSGGGSTSGGGGASGNGNGEAGTPSGSSGSSGFPGSGTGFAGDPLPPGLGPETSDACPTPPPIDTPTEVIGSATTCFYGDTPDPSVPAATIEQIIEVVNGRRMVHIRITFNPTFVDNSYGENAVGWGTPEMAGMMPGRPKPGKGGHTFKDLLGSDHIELELFNGDQTVSFHADVDYISEDPSSPCGYGTLGVTGGEGKMLVGSETAVLGVATSLDRDLNGCGYCLPESSPATDASYTPNPDAPKWDYRVVYELWIDAEVFGASGFGYAVIREVHASPSKIPGTNTVTVTPSPCPPGWDTPYCVPGPAGEGRECGSGTGGSGNVPDAGGVCPPGTVPDLASEGKFCVPV